MSQNDHSIANADGATVRADINSALQALASANSGATEPATKYPNQWWFDTTTSILKQRDNANTAWINTASKSGTNWVPYRNGTLLGDAAEKTIGTSGATVPLLNAANIWGGGQRGAIVTLSDGPTITPDFDAGNNFAVTLGGDRELANPTNLTAGQSGSIFIVQDGTGTRLFTYGSFWDFPVGTVPTLTTTANAVDRLDYLVRTTGSIHANLASDVK